MATLQTLRNKAGVLLAVIIGLSLLAFILGDFLNSGSGLLQRRQSELAEINGKSISYQDFAARLEQAVENYKTRSGITTVDEQTYASLRNQVWNSYINDFVYSDQYSKLGITVSSDELYDMVYGKNIAPQIQQADAFQNKQTGGFDKNLVMTYLKRMEQDPTGRAKQQWVQFEQGLMKDREYTKYQTLISKGLYVTKKMVDADFIETNRKYDLNFVALRYATTPDSLIQVTDADIQKYYDEHTDKFQQEATRDIAYLTWDIVPSQADKDAVKKWIFDQKPEFERIQNAGQYVNATGDNPFNENYLAPIDLPDSLRTWAGTATTGDVYGPYQEGLSWNLARITDVKMLPDSVKASHILIQPVNGVDFEAAQKTADSIKTLIENGQDFAALAAKYGTDATKDKGGDLGWFTMDRMIPEFAKACFFGKKGELLTVKTQYGVHVVRIVDQAGSSRKVQVAILTRTITPSDKTYQDVYNQASKFASTYNTGAKFEEGVVKENLNKRLATNLHAGDAAITGLENPRQLIRWAFTADKGDLSDLLELGQKFVLAELTVVREKGTAPLEQVRTQVENSVRNDKKAEYLIAQANQELQKVNTLEALAPIFHASVGTSANAYFTSYTISNIGLEPAVSAAMTYTPVNTISKPLKGANAVYLIDVTKVMEPGPDANRQDSRSRLEQSFASRAGYEVFSALEDNAKIVDKRNKFY